MNKTEKRFSAVDGLGVEVDDLVDGEAGVDRSDLFTELDVGLFEVPSPSNIVLGGRS